MSAHFDSARFGPELGGWGIRGVFCAALSFWWALVAGFNSPQEIAGVIAGVAVWVVLFAAYSAWWSGGLHPRGSRLVQALKVAAWLRCGISALGWLFYALGTLGSRPDVIIDIGTLGILPDGLPGYAAIAFVSALSGEANPGKLDSFGWTALVTVVDGALFAIVLGALAVGVLLWWHWGQPLGRKLLFPSARSAG